MLIFAAAFAFAADTAPLELVIEDPKIRTVMLKCGAEEMRADVRGGIASFPRAYSGCEVTMVRPAGMIGAPGRYTCDADRCVQQDVHHLPISDAPQRVNVVLTTPVPAGTSLEVNCPDGVYRERRVVTENTAIFDKVPTQECTLLFKGGVPAKYAPLKYGTWYCSLTGATAVCTLQ